MKKWKIIRNITLLILIIFLLFVLLIGLGIAFDNKGVYPDNITGLTKMGVFRAIMIFVMVFSGIPLVADVILLVISVIKIRKIN